MKSITEVPVPQPYLTANENPSINYSKDFTNPGDFTTKKDLFENDDLVFQRQLTYLNKWNFLYELVHERPKTDPKFLIEHYLLNLRYINKNQIEIKLTTKGIINNPKKAKAIREVETLAKKYKLLNYLFSKTRLYFVEPTGYSTFVAKKIASNTEVDFDDIANAAKIHSDKIIMHKTMNNNACSWLKSVDLETAKAIIQDLGLEIQFPS